MKKTLCHYYYLRVSARVCGATDVAFGEVYRGRISFSVLYSYLYCVWCSYLHKYSGVSMRCLRDSGKKCTHVCIHTCIHTDSSMLTAFHVHQEKRTHAYIHVLAYSSADHVHQKKKTHACTHTCIQTYSSILIQ